MIKIAIGQFRIIPGHPNINLESMIRLIYEAKAKKAQLVIFPELALSGCMLGDTWEQTSFLRECEELGNEIIAATQGIAVIFGNVAVDWDRINCDGRPRKFNAIFAAQNGSIVPPNNSIYPFYIKTLLPNYREFEESRHFFSLPCLAHEFGKNTADLISPFTFSFNNKKYNIGAYLCEDGWCSDFDSSPVEILNQSKLNLLVDLSSSPYTYGENTKRHTLFSKQAKECKVPLVYVNNTGIQNNGKTIYTFDGSSKVYNSKGEIIYCAKKYAEDLKLIDLDTIDNMPIYKQEDKPEIAHIYDALSYGIKTFLEDIHIKKVVIGVSGGIDSAVAAALYTKVLGKENVLLINMPSVYNSETTKGLAQNLAKNLKCQYAIIPIQDSVKHTIFQIESSGIHDFSNDTYSNLSVSDFVTENIQARDRSSRILAGAAAAFGGGFTCNANKAETTVGYSTLYGDQAGFLCALADLWKYQIYDLARYMNEVVYGYEVVPQATIDIVPSAELSNAQCVDEGKGDPIKYPYHDYLFRSFVENWNKTTPEDILYWYKEGVLEDNIGCEKGLVDKYFPDTSEFIADLERWWNQFCGMAVAKRIQSPPILAVSRRAYGFDHREAQNGVYYTRRYNELKEEILQNFYRKFFKNKK